jgi:hypothetical protein
MSEGQLNACLAVSTDFEQSMSQDAIVPRIIIGRLSFRMWLLLCQGLLNQVTSRQQISVTMHSGLEVDEQAGDGFETNVARLYLPETPCMALHL